MIRDTVLAEDNMLKAGDRVIARIGDKEWEGKLQLSADKAFPYMVQGIVFKESEVRKDTRKYAGDAQ